MPEPGPGGLGFRGEEKEMATFQESAGRRVWLCAASRCGRYYVRERMAAQHECQMHDGAQTCWPATWDPALGAYVYDGAAGTAPTTLFATANGYIICRTHLIGWRAGGNDVGAEVLDVAAYRADTGVEAACADCQDAAARAVPCAIGGPDCLGTARLGVYAGPHTWECVPCAISAGHISPAQAGGGST
jgi:hypothetical protein